MTLDTPFGEIRPKLVPESPSSQRLRLEAERKELGKDWGELQLQIKELLKILGKTEEQIRNDQWQLEKLLARADEIHRHESKINEELRSLYNPG